MRQQAVLFLFINSVIGALAFLATGALFGGTLFAYLGALLIALAAPQVCALIAVAGAVQVWNWHWFIALAVFLWPVVLTLLAFFGVIAGGIGLGALYSWKTRHHMKRDPFQSSADTLDSGPTIDGEYDIVDENE